MSKVKKHLNLISAFAITAVIALVAAIAGDFYFDLNDDVLMKDILSGAFTGAPEGRNIQMLYPISAFISCFYRISGAFDWYGIFLWGCTFLCIFLILFFTLKRLKDEKALLIATLLSEVLIFVGFYSPHLIFIQYTVVCGLLSSTAAFLIVISDKKTRIENILAVAMLLVAFLIRSEMMLLTLPMVLVAVLIKWYLCRDKDLSVSEKKSNFKKYLLLCIIIFAGLLICHMTNKLAYSSKEWKEFYRVFDNRTELYDFQYIPDYEENKDFYDSIGLSKSEQQLLINYNFGLDEEINADILGKIAEYAKSIRTEDTPVSERLKNSLSLYLYRLRYFSMPVSYEYPMSDFPWNIGVIILYLGAFALVIMGDRIKILLLLTLFACRSTLWIYIIYRGRDPIRITHPLYLCEIMIFLGFIILKFMDNKRYAITSMILTSVIGIMVIPTQLGIVSGEMARRDEMRANYSALYDYFAENPNSYYLVDVYTSVSYAAVKGDGVATFSEKMFENVNNDFANHDLMGGWASKSPLVEKKMASAGLASMEEALLEDRVFFVQNKTEDTTWLVDYYAEKGVDVSIEQIEIIADIFSVYKVERIG